MTGPPRFSSLIVQLGDQLRLLAVCPLLWLIVYLWPSRDRGFDAAMRGVQMIAEAREDDGAFL